MSTTPTEQQLGGRAQGPDGVNPAEPAKNR
jgi:hypothetical protein